MAALKDTIDFNRMFEAFDACLKSHGAEIVRTAEWDGYALAHGWATLNGYPLETAQAFAEFVKRRNLN